MDTTISTLISDVITPITANALPALGVVIGFLVVLLIGVEVALGIERRIQEEIFQDSIKIKHD